MVEVSNKHKGITVGVSSNNGNTVVAASSDVAQYWSQQARLSADSSKESAQEAKNYAELANSYIEGFEGVVTNNTNNIIATSNDCINQLNTTKEEAVENITTVKSESIASVEAKSNEVLSTVNAGIVEINNTKTTILQDIEFVAEGEKKEVEELAEKAKDDIESTGITSRADIDLSNLSAIGQAKFDAKVNKSGDTITGELVGNVEGSPYPFIAKSTVMDVKVTPTVNRFIGYDFRDKNDTRIGWIGIEQIAQSQHTHFSIQNISGVNGFIFPKCTTQPTTTPTADNYHVSVVTQNYVNGTSGYIVFSDKLGIQWGQLVNSTGGNLTQNTVTFLKPFANANYMIQRTNIGITGDGGATVYTTIKSKTASNFVAVTTTGSNTTTFSWLAIGYIA